MGHRTRGLAGVAVIALALVTGCGSDGGGSSGGDGGDRREQEKLASADEVIKVADKGFVGYRVERSSGHNSDFLSYGFVIENVSDKVALSVRVEVDFTDKAGKPIPDVSGGNDFDVVLPGQRMGAGGEETVEGGVVIGGMDVRVSMIASLDTPDGKRHRNPPAPYAELATGDPVQTPTTGSEKRETVTVEVTNTYDIPVTPKATAVLRDSAGVIVGGLGNNAMDAEIQPGAKASAKFPSRSVQLPRLAEVTIECYADPKLGWIVTRDAVWEDLL